MLDDLARLNEEQLVFLAIVSAMVLAAVTVLGVVAAVQIRKLRQKELELGFKDELLLRGHTVDEVIRLITSRKPGWSHGLLALADWAEAKLRAGTSSLSAVVREASAECVRVSRDLWGRAVPFFQRLQKESAPWFRAAVQRVHRGAQWLSGKTEELVRKWVTP